MEYRKFQNEDRVEFDHLIGRIDARDFLDTLGIEVSHPNGKDLMCHCPDVYGNHNNGDANPSFGFDTEDLVYNCFVCGGGTILDLVQLVTPIDTDEDALAFCETHSDINPDNDDQFVERMQRLLNPIADEEVLPSYPPDALFQYRYIHPYLLDRGISRETIIEMQVGFDADHYGIVIPHFVMGNLVGYQVRHLVEKDGIYFCPMCEPHHPQFKIPKYKNTPNFPKSTTLYGLDNVKEKKSSFVIVVESPMSALYLLSNGYPAVATFGSFSDAQMLQLVIFETVYLWLDNDEAGIKNALGQKKGKHGKREPGAISSLKNLTEVKIVPLVDQPKGDANDVPAEQLETYLNAAFPAVLLPIYGEIPTLDTVLANINS